MADYTGQRIGAYRLIRGLGRGSFADVYLGKHLTLKTEAAIKVLSGPIDAETLEHFLTEARHLRELEHPHIIRLHDFGMERDAIFLVMDYAPFGSLRARHAKGERLALSLVISYVQQIAAALDYAHARKLIHRDLKPENLLLGNDEQILLSDFGVALPLRTTDSLNVQSIGGTLAYMAPEQIRGKPSRASDQYALAVMVYEWLAGERPFGGVTAELCGQHLFVPPPSLCELVPSLPPEVEHVVFQALAKDPADRFDTCEAFAQALLKGGGPDLAPVPGRTRSSEPASQVETPRSSTSLKLVQTSLRERFIHLPKPLTSLVGREAAQQAASVLLMRPEVRLLTMTGPGGIGKTSLSLAIAHDLVEVFTDGICFVELAALHSPDQVLSSIVQTLSLKESSEEELLSSLKTFLLDKSFLLVLDNFEHVIDASPLLLDLLVHCPQLTLLVTSREVLHIPGEQHFPLVPLDLPTAEHKKDTTTLGSCSSIALFVQRAKEVRPEFELTEMNRQEVAEICTRLDGLPLAVELAAARIKLLSAGQVLTRLSSRLDFLSTSARTTSLRQQTVRKAIAWSYDLLTPDEQRLFRRLAVFVGGFTLADGEALYMLLQDDPVSVVDGITSLVDKSLLVQQEQPDGDLRLSMLETIRSFALEALSETGELEGTRAAHAAHCLSLIAEVEPFLLDLPSSHGMDRLKIEYRNLQTGLQVLQEHGQIEEALRIAAVLGAVGIWFEGGYMSEAKEQLEQTLSMCHSGESAVSHKSKARACFVLGWSKAWLGDFEQGVQLAEESLALFRTQGAEQEMAQVLPYISHGHYELENERQAEQAFTEGMALATRRGDQTSIIRYRSISLLRTFIRGEWEPTRAMTRENLQLAHARADHWFEAFNLHIVGWVAYSQQAYAEAATFGEKSVELMKRMGYPIWSTEILIQYAYEVLALSDDKKATALLQEALTVSQRSADQRELAAVLRGQGWIALRQGDLAEAQKRYEESLKLIVRSPYLEKRLHYIPASSLEGLAEIAIMEGLAAWAARLLGAAEAVRTNASYTTPIGLEQPFVKHTQTRARADLGEASFDETFSQGYHLAPLQAVSAHGPVEPKERAAQPDRAEDQTRGSKLPNTAPSHTLTRSNAASGRQDSREDLIPTESLTKRESDVLHLLAEGLSNAEIAARLMLSVVTVNSYLRSIYSKLRVSSRTRAIRYALERHLI